MNQDYRDIEEIDRSDMQLEPVDGNGGAEQVDATDFETEQLAIGIRETRIEMSGTIEALAQKLDPPTLMEQAREKAVETASEVVDHARESMAEAASTAVDQAKETVREATVGKVEGIMHNATHMVENAGQTAQETGNTVIKTIRENPIPAALAGIGLYMLWQKANSGQSRRASYSSGSSQPRGTYATGGYDRYQAYPDYQSGQSGQSGIGSTVQNAASSVGNTAGNVASTVGQTAGNVASTVGETAGSVVETVGQTAGNVASTVGDVAGQVGQTAGNVAEQVGQTAAQAGDQLSMTMYRVRREASRAMQENPLAIGAVAVAAGAAIGLAIPTTRQEQELLGNVRSTIVERAADTMDQTASKVEEAVGSAR